MHFETETSNMGSSTVSRASYTSQPERSTTQSTSTMAATSSSSPHLLAAAFPPVSPSELP